MTNIEAHKQILVFEDNPRAQRDVKNLLEKHGYRVFEFVNKFQDAPLAIQRAVHAGVLVALVDGTLIGGSESDGVLIANQLKSTPIKSVSHSTLDPEKMGADVVLGKVTSTEEFMHAIEQALALSNR